MGHPQEDQHGDEDIEEATGEVGEPVGGEEDVVPKSTTRQKKRWSRYDQHTEYQERLLQVQQEMLRTQQDMLRTQQGMHNTFKAMLAVMQQAVNGQQ